MTNKNNLEILFRNQTFYKAKILFKIFKNGMEKKLEKNKIVLLYFMSNKGIGDTLQFSK